MKSLLVDPRNSFVSINSNLIKQKFLDDFGANVNIVDIRNLCKARQLCTNGNCDMIELLHAVVKQDLPASYENLSNTVWDDETISSEQALFAFSQIVILAKIFEVYQATPLPPVKDLSTLAPGTSIAVVSKNKHIACKGIIVERNAALTNEELREYRAKTNFVFVNVTDIIAPSAKLPNPLSGIIRFEHAYHQTIPIRDKYVRLVDDMSSDAVVEPRTETDSRADILAHYTRFANELNGMCSSDYRDFSRDSNQPARLSSRVLLDPFHFMRRLDLPKRHSSQGEFCRALRDAMFILDDYDKRNVARYLQTQNKTFEEMVNSNWKWVAKRVRRYIPSPLTLMSRFMEVIRIFAHQRDSESNLPLFSGKTFKSAESMLEHIASGCLSDPPGEPLYFVRKFDEKARLNIYRCVRGTNSVEGSIHQKLLDKCATYNASPQFGDALMAAFRHRHNEKSSRRNRRNYPNVGHFDTWIVDDIQWYLEELHMFQHMSPDWCSAKSFKPTSQRYGFAPLGDIRNVGLMPFEGNRQLKPTTLQFLSQEMCTKYPILPVSTREERTFFKECLRNDGLKKNGRTDYVQICRAFNSIANGESIFFKLVSHIESDSR